MANLSLVASPLAPARQQAALPPLQTTLPFIAELAKAKHTKATRSVQPIRRNAMRTVDGYAKPKVERLGGGQKCGARTNSRNVLLLLVADLERPDSPPAAVFLGAG